MEIAFSLEQIFIGFNGIPVLRDVNFSLKKNEIHAIVGENGAGKSTLMKILTGIYKPDSGRITILGKEIEPGQASDALKQGVAMVYQDLSLIPSMTVAQNVFLSRHPFRRFGLLQDKKACDAVEEIFASMGLELSGSDASPISPDALVSDLSVGETQLVEIAKALASKPQIIVFDEPTAALSDIETARLFKTIQLLKEQGISIIYITHYLEDVMRICDSITVLRDGKVVSSKLTEEAFIASIVEDMLGPNAQLSQRNRTPLHSGEAQPLLNVINATTAAVGPVSLSAYPGEIVGLAGLLGSGRSEIFRLLYGLDPLTSGELQIDGQKISITHPNKAMQYGISLVPEERRTQGLVLDFSIMHNLSLGILKKLCPAFLLNGAQESHLALQSLQDLQIKAQGPSQLVRFLSGGNQQKVVFGKCLLSEPRILLLDDPTFGVDVHAKNEIMKIIEEFASKGNTVMFISSELGEIANFCHRIYIIKKKRVAQESASLNEEELLREVQ